MFVPNERELLEAICKINSDHYTLENHARGIECINEDYEQFTKSCECGYTRIVKHMIYNYGIPSAHCPPYDKEYWDFENPMCAAARNGQVEIVKILHDFGYTGPPGTFTYGVSSGNVELLKLLHAWGYKGTAGTVPPSQPYHPVDFDLAAKKGHNDILKLMHQWGYIGNHPIESAVWNDQIETVALLHELGYEDMESGDIAIRRGNIKMLQFLEKNGYVVECCDDAVGSPVMTLYLLKRGFKIDDKLTLQECIDEGTVPSSVIKILKEWKMLY